MREKTQTQTLTAMVCLLLWALLLPSTAAAESCGCWAQIKNAVSGKLETRYIGYEKSVDTEDRQHFFISELELNWSKSFANGLLLELAPKLQADNADRADNDWSFDERGLRRPRATFEHAALSYLGERLSVSLGKQVFAWGKGDLFSPSDDVNPSDTLDVPGAEKLGVTSAAIEYAGEYLSSQLLFLPHFVPNRVPMAGNRWTRSSEPLLAAATVALGFVPTLNIEPRELPDDEQQYGLRLTSSSLIQGWDLELSYFRGVDNEGVLEQSLTGTTLNLKTVYPRYEEYALGFSTTAGDLEIHAEASYHLTLAHEFDDDYVAYVAGGRYSFYGVELGLFMEEITIALEYAAEDLRRSRPDGGSYLSTGFSRALDNAMLSSIRFKFSEEASFEINGSYHLSDSDYSAQALYTYRPLDALELAASVEFFRWARGLVFR